MIPLSSSSGVIVRMQGASNIFSSLTILLTTHDLNGLAAHLPRLVCFNKTVIADGNPREVLTSQVLEATYGAPMEVLEHGGMPIVVEHGPTRVRGEGK